MSTKRGSTNRNNNKNRKKVQSELGSDKSLRGWPRSCYICIFDNNILIGR